MRKFNLAAGVAILSATLIAGGASAAQTASVSGCLDMAQQVKAALAANAGSPNYQEAVKQQGFGRDFCTNNFYQAGINHYNQALNLLGVKG